MSILGQPARHILWFGLWSDGGIAHRRRDKESAIFLGPGIYFTVNL